MKRKVNGKRENHARIGLLMEVHAAVYPAGAVLAFCLAFLCVSCSGAASGGGSAEDTTGRFAFDLPPEIVSPSSGAIAPVAFYKLEMSSATGFENESVCGPSPDPVVVSDVESGRWLIVAYAVGEDGQTVKSSRRTVSLSIGEEKRVPLGFEVPLSTSGPDETNGQSSAAAPDADSADSADSKGAAAGLIE